MEVSSLAVNAVTVHADGNADAVDFVVVVVGSPTNSFGGKSNSSFGSNTNQSWSVGGNRSGPYVCL